MEQNYQQQTLMGATGVELILALYDGMIRFLYRATQCIEEEDVRGRRLAVSRALDILMYLQARLRPDVGGATAQSLSDFYAAMFTQVLEASHLESVEQLQEIITLVRNVRDAWVIAAKNSEANRVLPRELRTREELFAGSLPPDVANEVHRASSWSA